MRSSPDMLTEGSTSMMQEHKEAMPEDMNDMGSAPEWETISTDSFQFRFAFRETASDRGPTLEVYANRPDGWKEVLKFDCFQNGPHWHRCHPEGADDRLQLEPAGIGAGIDFATKQLRENFRPLMEEQGFS